MLVPLLAAVVAALVAVVTPAAVHEPRPAPVAAALGAPAPSSPALVALHRWDAARARAWASGEPAALRRLYVPGAAAGRADVALLRRYLARGLVVTGMSQQVLAVRVTRAGTDRLVLRVTDRLVGAVAVSVSAHQPLPASAPLTRRLELRRVGEEWRMATIRAVRPTAPP
ncbi:hypothetical protein D9V37_11140 [Nocardioides mangrovicus]|uniref:SnoaL-like domain-containing protein n=1 Tax=Nocardioides mangrovicus TaxID=2478913 RepID=A0A3L8P0Z4_9ACTN|nr:hypothetical protein D9V37_11140 [Nocardioides mangrovicus]